MSWLWGTSQLDDAIDKATSELLPAGTEDIALNLEISDQIRSKSVPAKDAMRSLKRRLDHKNPNVQISSLSLIDLCVKNGGDHFLVEIASKEFMDNLVSILKYPGLNHEVKQKILRLVQNWSISFEGKPSLSYVSQIYKSLKNEGFSFPPPDAVATSSAMIDTSTAPEWIDSDVCMRCRTAFSFTNRKHHCRNCGQVFDQQCSAKILPLPHFGIAQEVRVCDSCYVKVTKNRDKSGDSKGHRHSSSAPNSRHRGARELADAELQRAIQLSLEEAGMTGALSRSGYTPSYAPPPSEPPIVDRQTRPEDEEMDPDLRAAIEASLREANAPKPSAPAQLDTPRVEAYSPGVSQSYPPQTRQPQGPSLPNYDLDPLESDAIMTFSQMVGQVHNQGGRDIAHYPALNQLHDQANSLRPKLVTSLDDTGKREQLLTEMHDKLSQAVKIYDNILTEQVSHPTWRSAPPTRAPPQQYNQYSQWSQSAPQQDIASPSQPSAPYQYAPPAEQNWHQQQQLQQQQPQYYPSQIHPSISQSTMVSQPPTQPYTPVSAPPPPPPSQLPQNPGPIYSPPPPSTPSIRYEHAPPHAANFGRSNTVAHPRQPQQQQQVPHRMYSTPPAPVPLPSFPVAPTSAPQAMFPSVPSAVEQSDRQEVLLIDL